MRLYIYICMCVYVCVFTNLYVHIIKWWYIKSHISEHMYICIYICMCICVFGYVCIAAECADRSSPFCFIYVPRYKWVNIYIWLYMLNINKYIRLFQYINRFAHWHMYIYIYIYVDQLGSSYIITCLLWGAVDTIVAQHTQSLCLYVSFIFCLD